MILLTAQPMASMPAHRNTPPAPVSPLAACGTRPHCWLVVRGTVLLLRLCYCLCTLHSLVSPVKLGLGCNTCVLASSHVCASVSTKAMENVIAPCEWDEVDCLGSYQTAVGCHPRRPQVVPVNNIASTWVWDNISHPFEDPGQGDLGSYTRPVGYDLTSTLSSHSTCWKRVTTTNLVTLDLLDTTWHRLYRHTRPVGYDPTLSATAHFCCWVTFNTVCKVVLLLLEQGRDHVGCRFQRCLSMLKHRRTRACRLGQENGRTWVLPCRLGQENGRTRVSKVAEKAGLGLHQRRNAD